MPAVAQGRDRHPMFARARHRRFEHDARSRMAEAALAVVHQGGAAVADETWRTIENDAAAAHAAQVQGQHGDAVTVVTGEVGVDQVPRDLLRFRVCATGATQDCGDQLE